jgi:hypothetical protein
MRADARLGVGCDLEGICSGKRALRAPPPRGTRRKKVLRTQRFHTGPNVRDTAPW